MISRVLNFRIGFDVYEIYIRNNVIARIVQYCGDSQFQREIPQEELSDEVLERIVEELNKDYA